MSQERTADAATSIDERLAKALAESRQDAARATGGNPANYGSTLLGLVNERVGNLPLAGDFGKFMALAVAANSAIREAIG